MTVLVAALVNGEGVRELLLVGEVMRELTGQFDLILDARARAATRNPR